jgi:hypothetical protein
MGSKMQGWVIAAVISFLIRQIGKYGEGLDWDSVKADAHARIDDLVPKPFSGVFYGLADSVLDVFKTVLARPEDLASIAQAVASGDLAGACKQLVDLITAVVHPSSPVALSGLKTLLDEGEEPGEPTT